MLTQNFRIDKQYGACYTGGKIILSYNNQFLLCSCSNDLAVLDIATGLVVTRILSADDAFTSFALRPGNKEVYTSCMSGLIKRWILEEGNAVCKNSWKSHSLPVLDMSFDKSGFYLASGSSNGELRVWDAEKTFCTHYIGHGINPVNKVFFHPDKYEVFSCAQDGEIRSLILETSLTHSLRNHMSPVTCLAFLAEKNIMLSSGRDGIVNFWSLNDYKLLITHTIFDPQESLESVIILPSQSLKLEKEKVKKMKTDNSLFLTSGDKGIIRLWDTEKILNRKSKSCIQKHSLDQNQKLIITHLFICNNNTLISVTSDHLIHFWNFYIQSISRVKVITGYNDSIVESKFLPNGKNIVLGTNSESAQIVNLDNFDCQILYGHTDMILSLDVSNCGNYIVTSSKDQTCRLWIIINIDNDDKSKSKSFCIGIGKGHTEAVSAISMAKGQGQDQNQYWFVTGSNDRTMKKWDYSTLVNNPNNNNECVSLISTHTKVSHSKEINTVIISPTNLMIATGSQDKTIKLWDSELLKPLGTLTGHKRAIWDLKFSPVQKIIASSSGDHTIKIWNLIDYTCLRTLHEHTSGVFSIQFINNGMQMISGGGDGNIKIWNIKSSECIKTLESKHEDKIWTVSVSPNGKQMISGGSDSILYLWYDSTEIENLESTKLRNEQILQEQRLSNLLQDKKFSEAVLLTLSLDQPRRAYNVFEQLIVQNNDSLKKIIFSLTTQQLEKLLIFIRDWNANSKTCVIAQILLKIIISNYTQNDIMKLTNIREIIDAILAYTERHYNRIDHLLEKSFLTTLTYNDI